MFFLPFLGWIQTYTAIYGEKEDVDALFSDVEEFGTSSAIFLQELTFDPKIITEIDIPGEGPYLEDEEARRIMRSSLPRND